jgi:hypothetical protein
VKDRCEDEIALKWPARQAAGRPKKTAAPPPPRIPRITRLMALAIKFQDMIDRGEVKDYADLARLGFVTRARVTQIMNLCLLAPDIQEAILDADQSLNESTMRRVALSQLWQDQRRTISDINPRRQPQRLAVPPSPAEEVRGTPQLP